MEMLRVGALSFVEAAVVQRQAEDNPQRRKQPLVADLRVPARRSYGEDAFQPAAGDQRDVDGPFPPRSS
jgi:hypothetical protein